MRNLVRRVLIPGAIAAVVASGGFAFMANNTVAASFAGQGTASISGYNVSNIHYNLKDNGNGQGTDMYIESVTFNLDHPVSMDNVYALVYNTVNTPARYGDCSVTGGSTATPQLTCAHSGNMQALTAATKLGVIAAS